MKKHIESYGGDPDDITLFGMSAGDLIYKSYQFYESWESNRKSKMNWNPQIPKVNAPQNCHYYKILDTENTKVQHPSTEGFQIWIPVVTKIAKL